MRKSKFQKKEKKKKKRPTQSSKLIPQHPGQVLEGCDINSVYEECDKGLVHTQHHRPVNLSNRQEIFDIPQTLSPPHVSKFHSSNIDTVHKKKKQKLFAKKLYANVYKAV